MTTNKTKGPSFIGALTLCGEIVLAATIAGAAFLSSGVGFPTGGVAQAASAPIVLAAAQVVASD
jgi:hypothetical protein